MKARTRRLLLAALTAMLVVSSGAAPVVAQSDSPHIAQQSDKTTPTLTPTAEKCGPSDAPQMETARLFAREDTITGQAGVVAGGFLPPTGLQFESYEQEEKFYVAVADRLEITPWELDRILYRYTDEVIAKIE